MATRRRSPRNSSQRGRLRAAVRSAALAALALVSLALIAVPASADDVGDTYSPDPLSPLAAVGLFVGIPALAFLISWILAVRSQRGVARYRPGRGWPYEQKWFGELPAEEHEGERRKVAVPGAGGASGRW
jgi:hypothetical protein